MIVSDEQLTTFLVKLKLNLNEKITKSFSCNFFEKLTKLKYLVRPYTI